MPLVFPELFRVHPQAKPALEPEVLPRQPVMRVYRKRRNTPMDVWANAFVWTDGPLEAHALSLIYPEMPEKCFKGFSEDISGLGLNYPIALHEGKILDGRARYRACIENEIDVWVHVLDEGEDPEKYLRSMNLARQSLTDEQVEEVMKKALEYHLKDARERSAAQGWPWPGDK